MFQHPALARAAAFCEAFNLRVPIPMAPMAGACPASLVITVANAGGLGGCGALLMQPDAIQKWVAEVRAGTNGGFQLNLWIPDPPAMLEAGPPVISSVMGLYPDGVVARMKSKGIKWFATVKTVSEARAAESAGADVVVAQGMEAGGHRGDFDATS